MHIEDNVNRSTRKKGGFLKMKKKEDFRTFKKQSRD